MAYVLNRIEDIYDAAVVFIFVLYMDENLKHVMWSKLVIT